MTGSLEPTDERLRGLSPVAVGRLFDAGDIIELLHEGVAVVDSELRVVWGNKAFREWCDCDPAGRAITELFSGPQGSNAVSDLFGAARAGRFEPLRFPCGEERWVDLRVSPTNAEHRRFVVQLHDVTHEERRRQKLIALHHAGRVLINWDAEFLAEMSVDDRTELLKHNIRQIIHQLLNYDTIEIRLLDRATKRLVPLLADGMTPEAEHRELFALETGNGVTGYVAAKGRSYLCLDTTNDPHYLVGAVDAKSSLTVPIMSGEDVIGTFNVESPRVNAFTERDLQFTETFSRYVAHALHTLELLQAEKSTTASASMAAISREVAMPSDAILNQATKLLNRTDPADADAMAYLRGIIANVRTIKNMIRNVSEQLAPARAANAREAAVAEKLHGKNVLVVDSDERIRKNIHTMLGKFGCEVEAAGSAQEAVCMAQSGAYDAFLLDIRLPDGSAYATYCQIRALQPAAIPIMMTTFGYDSAHSIVRARQNGLRAVLLKPIRLDQVLDALTQPAAQPPQPAAAV